MFKSIIVPLDGSTLAEAVLPYVRTLTRALHSRVTLLHVMDADGGTSPRNLIGLMTAAKAEEALVLARRRVEEYLAKLAETMAGIEVRQVVATGCPGKAIAAEADSSDGINLIAMSTHGRSGIGRWIIGSITDKVIHTATSFMLVVRSSREMSQTEGEAPLQRIILPLDGSELSQQAIPTALELSKRLGLEVTLFHVVSTMQLSMAEEWPAGYPDVLEEVEDDATRLPGGQGERAQQPGSGWSGGPNRSRRRSRRDS